MAKSSTLNRFPLLGLFAQRAARKMGYNDDEARLLGYSTEYLAAYDADQLNTGDTLFELYRAWRDECKVGFNRVGLEKLVGWLGKHSG